MNAMVRTVFDGKLEAITAELLHMGATVESALLEAVETLRIRDFEASKRLIARDREINKMRYSIEGNVLMPMNWSGVLPGASSW